MKIAVLSDIHGNLEAFEAVNADIRQRGVDRVICLGDNIGYGPDPEEVVRRIRQLGYSSLLGNHELALLDRRARRWMNFQAEENNIATSRMLSRENLAYCCTLPKFLTLNAAYFVHGFPPFSVFRYLDRQSEERLATLFATTAYPLLFVGHTHKLQLVSHRQGIIVRRPLQQEILELKAGEKHILNAGSVGQPRDGDNCAKYLLWDKALARVEVVYVAYDYRITMEKIKGLGFPNGYAARLG